MTAALDLRAAARARRPRLPEPGAHRSSAIATWRGRMIAEHTSSRVFEALAGQLARAGVAAEEIDAVAAFADEERSHGVLCGAVVEALGGEAYARLDDLPAVPEHEDVDPLEGALRNVLSIGCLSETVAVSLIGAERAEMPEGELRTLLTRIWADEIGHARFGWRFVTREVPRLDRAAHARLEAYLDVALRHLVEHELAHLPEAARFGPDAAPLGLCSGPDARRLFLATIRQVILPRLAALGLAPASSRVA